MARPTLSSWVGWPESQDKEQTGITNGSMSDTEEPSPLKQDYLGLSRGPPGQQHHNRAGNDQDHGQWYLRDSLFKDLSEGLQAEEALKKLLGPNHFEDLPFPGCTLQPLKRRALFFICLS